MPRAATGARAESQRLGQAFAEALAGQSRGDLETLLHPDIDFQALTPGRTWQADSPDQVLETLMDTWFPSAVAIEESAVEVSTFSDCPRLAYRLRGHKPDGAFVVEQHAFFRERDGKIDWMRVLCSGFRAP